MRTRPAAVVLLALGCCLLTGPPARAAAGAQEIIVKRDPHLTKRQRADLRTAAGVVHVRNSSLADVELVRAAPGRLQATLDELNARADVRFAEPNGRVSALSDDPDWAGMWGLHNTGQTGGTVDADIDAPEAWGLTSGAGETVAVVDTGVQFYAADLAGRFATNPGESGGDKDTNGLDDDGDGLIDDARGWDFVDSDKDPTDLEGHGTGVAGVMAANRNEIGAVGVAPAVNLLPLRVLDAAGQGTDLDVAEAFDLAGNLHIPIVNASLGGPGPSETLAGAVARHPDTLYVVAAGNDGADNDGSDPEYPCALPQANVVCVGASDQDDAPADFSNFGARSVDLFAPGVEIIITANGECAELCYFSGTSAAAPHVAGILALMRAHTPALTATQLKARLLAGADRIPALRSRSVSGARANAFAALNATDHPVPEPTPVPDGDGDGRSDRADNCTAVWNPDQLDSDADGLGNACDPSPSGSRLDALGTSPAPSSILSGAPLLSKPSLSRTSVSRRRSANLVLRLNRAATVRLTATRKTRRGYRRAGVVSLKRPAGVSHYTLKVRFGKRKLRAGRYQLKVVALDGRLASRTYTLRFRVR